MLSSNRNSIFALVLSTIFGLTLINIGMSLTPDAIRGFYEEAFAKLGKQKEIQVDVVFYPYVGINHTIRLRSGRAYVRIGEICRDMPADAQRALAYILVSKLFGKRVPAEARDAYSSFIKTGELRERAVERKRAHGRKVVTGSAGRAYDLNEIFDLLNEKYFNGALKKPVLTWSVRKTYRILGHHDSTHDTVVVSRSLDSPSVPHFVVEYVVYHEMLHIHYPTVHHNGRRYNHTAAFRRDEQKFTHFHAAERWIELNVRKLKRQAKKR